MKMLKHALVAIVFCLSLTPAARAIDANEMFADPEQEARAREIGRELRCLVCQNQSIFDSNAALAKDLRVVVRERMEAGDSDEEVLEFIRVRFGDYVLLEPPVDTHTAVLWVTPVAFMALAGAVLFARSRKAKVPVQTGMSDADRQEARRLLEQGDAR